MAYISNLPLLFANGQPTSLNAMSLVDLQYFIPFLMKCTTGQDPKYWGTLQKPNWWPTDVPFSQKIIYPSLAISDINQVWTSRFRVLVYNCYIYYGCKYLLDFSAHLRDCDREGVTYQRNNDGTISAFDRTEGKLLVNFRDVNRDYDFTYRQTPINKSEIASNLFNALSTCLEEDKKLKDDNMRLMKDLEEKVQIDFLTEALTRTQNEVKKLKDVNMKLLKAPKRRADSIDIGQRKESFFSKSTADVGKETASTSDETSSDVQTPQLVESGPSKSSSQSSLQELKTGVSKGGKAPATSNRTLAVGMQNKEEPRSEPLILSENISTAARRNANAKNTTALLIREVPNDGTHVDEKLASKAKDRVNSSDPGLNVTAEVGKSTPQSSCSIPEEQNEPAPSLENRSSGVQTRQLAESGLSKPSSQRSRQKLKTKVSKGKKKLSYFL
ncbi:hypothetical protein QYM36_002893 [Artemia franciscana]|uniref:Nuclear respiratory factor 1 NLS/DNA-binding dimerisation domain-containing protein n=1 Tax=Artemia franciscana TaxID=6661 RepID=A0AA88I8V2_ARTSF|nr:hypothetical protein QYM36_002893 [Artemia franciscana]